MVSYKALNTSTRLNNRLYKGIIGYCNSPLPMKTCESKILVVVIAILVPYTNFSSIRIYKFH